MGIRIEHGRPETLIAAAQRAGEAQAALRAQEKAERLQAQQMEFEYKQALRQQDMVIDLQMNERAKLWQIEKMEMASRMDFQREEQKRQRQIDEASNAGLQIEKEIKAGRADPNDPQIQSLQLYYKIKEQFPESSPPVGLLRPPVEKKERVVTPSQRISAMKALREEEYQEPTWLQRFLPYGKEPLSPELEAEREILRGIVGGEYAVPTAPQIAPQVPEPVSVKEFEDTVAQLKTIDIDKARLYYNKWAGKF